MRSTVQMKKSGSGKPLLLLICAMATIWAAIRCQGLIQTALAKGMSGDAAVALLRAETPEMPLFTRQTLLSFATPLFAEVNAPLEPEQGEAPVQIEPQPPVMTPALPFPSHTPRPQTPEPSVAEDGEVLDDRVWPTPDEDDPDAHPLREVTLLPLADDGSYLTDGSVRVNNSTEFSIDVPALLAREVKQKPSAEGPHILIIHTHGSESYLPDERDYYIPTDVERTEDTRYNVVRVGDELEERLTALGLSVIHDREIHDYPTYNGSYGRSLTCIQEYMKKYPSIQVVLDIHRDSVSSADGTMYKAVCETDYGKTAQMMFVVGSNGTGLPHDGWRDNLSFAARLQSLLLEECPTLMRPIHLRKERFNQHATPASLILEVGTAGNSLTEALRAIRQFADTAGPYLAELLLP